LQKAFHFEQLFATLGVEIASDSPLNFFFYPFRVKLLPIKEAQGIADTLQQCWTRRLEANSDCSIALDQHITGHQMDDFSFASVFQLDTLWFWRRDHALGIECLGPCSADVLPIVVIAADNIDTLVWRALRLFHHGHVKYLQDEGMNILDVNLRIIRKEEK
jgi:hypothetical protein